MSEQGKVRILCVDDNFLVVDSLAARLAREPWITVVGTLSDADRVVNRVAEGGVDVVLLDVDMPGRDPFSALEELTESHPEVRTIMLSGHVRSEFIDRAVACGAWGYLPKTSAAGEIIAAIRAVRDGGFAFSGGEAGSSFV